MGIEPMHFTNTPPYAERIDFVRKHFYFGIFTDHNPTQICDMRLLNTIQKNYL